MVWLCYFECRLRLNFIAALCSNEQNMFVVQLGEALGMQTGESGPVKAIFGMVWVSSLASLVFFHS